MLARLFTRWLIRNYRAGTALKFFLFRRFTPGGLLVLAGMFFSASIGVDTNEAMAFQAFAILATGLAFAFVWAKLPVPELRATRLPPRLGTVGHPLGYELLVINPTRKTQHGVEVWEHFTDPRPTPEEFASTPEPGEHRRNLFDRVFRYYRYLWLLERKILAVSKPRPVPTIQPGGSVGVRMEIHPKRRGVLRFTGVTFGFADPFGLCRGFDSFDLPQEVLILPRRYNLPPMDLPGGLQYQPGGVNLASAVGESAEFTSLREYRRGDAMRHIHWKSVGKTGKLVVKEFQEEFFVRHALILDTFLDTSAEDIFEEAVSLASSFAWAMQSQESLLDLLFVGPEAYCFTAGRGVGHVEQLLEILASVAPCTAKPFDTLTEAIVRRIQLVSGVVCVFLKWDASREALVKLLRANRVPLRVFVILPKDGNPAPAFPPADATTQFHALHAGELQEELLKL